MHDPFLSVLEFHRRFGIHEEPFPGFPPQDVIDLRMKLIEEEFTELQEAIADRDIIETADAFADLLYVLYGAAIECGIDIRPVFAEVHRTNMLKVGGPTRADGKIEKPPGWKPPDLAPILRGMKREEGVSLRDLLSTER